MIVYVPVSSFSELRVSFDVPVPIAILHKVPSYWCFLNNLHCITVFLRLYTLSNIALFFCSTLHNKPRVKVIVTISLAIVYSIMIDCIHCYYH